MAECHKVAAGDYKEQGDEYNGFLMAHDVFGYF
jgi:hypothetical protein